MTSARPFDPRDFTGIGHENGIAAGSASTPTSGIYDANAVLEGFEPAVLLSQPRGSIRRRFSRQDVAGSVLVEFLIDTTGRVERGSVRMIESSDPAFEDADLAGRPVRQITQQWVRFVAADWTSVPVMAKEAAAAEIRDPALGSAFPPLTSIALHMLRLLLRTDPAVLASNTGSDGSSGRRSDLRGLSLVRNLTTNVPRMAGTEEP